MKPTDEQIRALLTADLSPEQRAEFDRLTKETPQEHIRNALAVLVGLAERMDHGVYLQLEEDLVAIKARLWKAVNQLEAK